MSDWDVIAPIKANNEEEDNISMNEEQYNDFEDEQDYEQNYEQDYGQNSHHFFEDEEDEQDFNTPHYVPPVPAGVIRNRHQDRVAFRHRTGAGYRKPQLSAGHEIDDAIMAYNEGYHSYNGRTQELRESTVDDLIPDHSEARYQRDNIVGAGSKVITEVKLRRGTNKRHPFNYSKNDILSTKTDQDVKHYFDHVSHTLMEEGSFVQAKYEDFRNNALTERENLGIGRSAEMNSLYCFWSFYLREHFNREMYDQFLDLAREDVVGGSHYGIECFFRFCSYGLELFWDPAIYEDFQNEAINDYNRNSTYGLEKLRAFLINQKHDFPIPTRPDVEVVLDKYPTIQSFREQQQSKRHQFSGKNFKRAKFNQFAQYQPKDNQQNNNDNQQNNNDNQQNNSDNQQNNNNNQSNKYIPAHLQQNNNNNQSNKYIPIHHQQDNNPQNNNQQYNNPRRGRGGTRGRGRGGTRGRGREYNNTSGTVSIGGWVFGKVQPVSVPVSSPMKKL